MFALPQPTRINPIPAAAQIPIHFMNCSAVSAHIEPALRAIYNALPRPSFSRRVMLAVFD
jgi:hypothetical protein